MDEREREREKNVIVQSNMKLYPLSGRFVRIWPGIRKFKDWVSLEAA
jgi:hypothetical protein